MTRMTRSRKSVTTLAVIAISLAACGGAGPSQSEVRDALSEHIRAKSAGFDALLAETTGFAVPNFGPDPTTKLVEAAKRSRLVGCQVLDSASRYRCDVELSYGGEKEVMPVVLVHDGRRWRVTY